MLNATFKEADKLDVQDALGRAVAGAVGAIPDGVLLFLPSYSLMDKLVARWKVSKQGARRGQRGGEEG